MQETNEIVNTLAKSDDNKFKKEDSKEFQKTKATINEICKSLSKPSKSYDPEKTVKILVDYLKSEDRMQRILYSEISNYLFSRSEKERGNFLSNIDDLLCSSLDKSENSDPETEDRNGSAVPAEDKTITKQKKCFFLSLKNRFFGGGNTKNSKKQQVPDAASGPETAGQPAPDAASGPETAGQPTHDAALGQETTGQQAPDAALEPETDGQPATDATSVTSESIGLKDDVKKLIIKIYDHTQLVNYQIESNKSIFKTSINEEMASFREQTKAIEKEYITILGIFASIIIAFVGSFTFSTSVLSNIAKVDFERLMIIALFIGLAFFNLIAYLIEFLRDISHTESSTKIGAKIWRSLIIIIVDLILIFSMGYFMWKGSYIDIPFSINAGAEDSDIDTVKEEKPKDAGAEDPITETGSGAK